MANRIKSGIKRVQIAERNRLRNIAAKSEVKTLTKKFTSSVEADASADEIKANLSAAISKIDRTVSKGIIHKNTAGRKKASLMKLANDHLRAKA